MPAALGQQQAAVGRHAGALQGLAGQHLGQRHARAQHGRLAGGHRLQPAIDALGVFLAAQQPLRAMAVQRGCGLPGFAGGQQLWRAHPPQAHRVVAAGGHHLAGRAEQRMRHLVAVAAQHRQRHGGARGPDPRGAVLAGRHQVLAVVGHAGVADPVVVQARVAGLLVGPEQHLLVRHRHQPAQVVGVGAVLDEARNADAARMAQGPRGIRGIEQLTVLQIERPDLAAAVVRRGGQQRWVDAAEADVAHRRVVLEALAEGPPGVDPGPGRTAEPPDLQAALGIAAGQPLAVGREAEGGVGRRTGPRRGQHAGLGAAVGGQ